MGFLCHPPVLPVVKNNVGFPNELWVNVDKFYTAILYWVPPQERVFPRLKQKQKTDFQFSLTDENINRERKRKQYLEKNKRGLKSYLSNPDLARHNLTSSVLHNTDTENKTPNSVTINCLCFN